MKYFDPTALLSDFSLKPNNLNPEDGDENATNDELINVLMIL